MIGILNLVTASYFLSKSAVIAASFECPLQCVVAIDKAGKQVCWAANSNSGGIVLGVYDIEKKSSHSVSDKIPAGVIRSIVYGDNIYVLSSPAVVHSTDLMERPISVSSYDQVTLKCTGVTTIHGNIFHAAIDADGHCSVVASSGRWRVGRTGKAVLVAKHNSLFRALSAFAEKPIITSSRSPFFIMADPLLSIYSPEYLLIRESSGEAISSMAVSENGQILFVARHERDRCLIESWDLKQRMLLGALSRREITHLHVAISYASGTMLVCRVGEKETSIIYIRRDGCGNEIWTQEGAYRAVWHSGNTFSVCVEDCGKLVVHQLVIDRGEISGCAP